MQRMKQNRLSGENAFFSNLICEKWLENVITHTSNECEKKEYTLATNDVLIFLYIELETCIRICYMN